MAGGGSSAGGPGDTADQNPLVLPLPLHLQASPRPNGNATVDNRRHECAYCGKRFPTPSKVRLIQHSKYASLLFYMQDLNLVMLFFSLSSFKGTS